MTNYTMIQFRDKGDWQDYRAVALGHLRTQGVLESARLAFPEIREWRTVPTTETAMDRLDRLPAWADQG